MRARNCMPGYKVAGQKNAGNPNSMRGNPNKPSPYSESAKYKF